jgi:LSD1 subclass zinc finger protein
MTVSEQIRIYTERRDIAIKIYALDMLGGQCVQCGERRVFALEFDHIVPTRKRDNYHTKPSELHVGNSIFFGHENLFDIQILCASCHRIKSYYEGTKRIRGAIA